MSDKPKKKTVADYPELVAQWHPTKNGDLRPEDVSAGNSRLKVWWKCSGGPDHEWSAPPGPVLQSLKRVQSKQKTNYTRKNAYKYSYGCPFCSNLRLSVTNALTVIRPDLAAEFHPTKNGELKVEQLVVGSAKKVWWKCPVADDHEWPTSVSKRTYSGRGCPFCSGKRASKTNCVATKAPRLIPEWHPTKNGDKTPWNTVATTGIKIWWLCPKHPSHVWDSPPRNRYRQAGLCPFCVNQRVCSTNSLAALFPEIAAEWHPSKNGSQTPNDVVAGSDKKVWWQCPNGADHQWSMTPYRRTVEGLGCQRCEGRWTTEGVKIFVESILGHIHSFNAAELHLLFQQSGLFTTKRKSSSFIKALATGRFPQDELEKFVSGEPSLVDDFVSGEVEDLESFELDDEIGELSEEAQGIEAALDAEAVGNSDDEAFPVVQTKDALNALDFHVIASSDEEAVQYLIASALGKLWRHAYQEPDEAIAQAEAFSGGEYATQVRETFIAEFKAAQDLQIPDGYDFRPRGKLAQPNLMQRLVAVRVRENKRYGNWSGTGAGKTLSAVLSTRVVGADLTVICCPNAVVDNWVKEVQNIFPDSTVASKTWEPDWPTGNSAPRYLVQNFEQFQQPDSEGRLKAFCEREQVKFIIIDEIHYAKQRHTDQMSKRKRLVNGMVATETEENPDLYVLGMSATPVINNLTEGRSLVEMITGLTHEDLETKATVANCMRLYQRLVTLGTRWKPNYKPQLIRMPIEVDCGDAIDEIRALGKAPSPLALEKILTQARMPTILEYCERGKKTLIYTLFVDEIDKMLYDALTAKGLKVGFYTGEDKSGLKEFLKSDTDVLIGSSSIGTGVDGLQDVCNRLIINVLPWTNAEYEQLVGRVYRQGQRSDKVEVIIPTTFAMVNGERWSYCESKLKRIEYKRSIADAAVDGAVPEGNLRSPAQAQRDVMAWLERLERGETAEVVRTRITVPLSDDNRDDVKRRLSTYGDFSTMNARWNTSKSVTLSERLEKNPEEWQQYHTLYRQARESWTVVPFQEMVNWAKDRQGHVIADFGCGEALFGKAAAERHTVYSFDHVAINESVVATDMANIPLDDETLDDAIFSLSLMGANFSDYLREAYRTLKLDGSLHVWEATSRFDDPERFARELTKLGFKASLPEQRGSFTYIEARKTRRVPIEGAALRFRVKDEQDG